MKQKHIKPCDSSLKSVKVYRALAQGALARQVVSEYKWLQAYVQPLQCMTLFWWRILWHFFKQRWKLCAALSGDSKKWKKCLWLSVRVPLSFTPNAMWQSIVWQPLHSIHRAQTIALCETKKSSPVTTIWNQQKFTELWTKEYLCVFDMNREMEKKITPQGGGLCIFWSYFLLHFHFCTLQVQCQVFPLRPTIVKEVGDEFVSYLRFCLTLKAFVLLTPFCQCVALREYAQSQ